MPAPDVAGALPTRTVFVATTRKAEGDGFGSERAEAPSYHRFDITLPPARAPGSIPVPSAEADPATQFLLAGHEAFDGAAGFRADLRRDLAGRRPADREAIVYVHGFNNTFDEGLLRLTQLAVDFDIAGAAVHYSWPSAGRPLGYAYDRDSVLVARDGLDQLISDIRAAGARRVILVGHSVGAALLMETLRQRAIARPGSVAQEIEGVILLSPDIDIDVFRAQARRIGTLPQPFGVFVSQRDRVLALSARLSGQDNRLGNVETVDTLADLPVTVIDVSGFSTGAGHFTAATSPALIELFARAGDLSAAFVADSAGRTGLISGTVLTVQNATEIILSPVTALAR